MISTSGLVRAGEFFSPIPRITPRFAPRNWARSLEWKAEFDKRNVKVIAISVDAMESHRGWVGDINETQKTVMNFPIIADPKREVATLYDMIHPKAGDTFTVRSVFVIGPDKKIKMTLTYPTFDRTQFSRIVARD